MKQATSLNERIKAAELAKANALADLVLTSPHDVDAHIAAQERADKAKADLERLKTNALAVREAKAKEKADAAAAALAQLQKQKLNECIAALRRQEQAAEKLVSILRDDAGNALRELLDARRAAVQALVPFGKDVREQMHDGLGRDAFIIFPYIASLLSEAGMYPAKGAIAHRTFGATDLQHHSAWLERLHETNVNALKGAGFDEAAKAFK
jgi:hypothetical protein